MLGASRTLLICERRGSRRPTSSDSRAETIQCSGIVRMSELFVQVRYARIPPMPRFPAIAGWCVPAISAAPRQASTPGCRWATGVLRNVERIVREEMDAIGAQEVSTFPLCCQRSRTRPLGAGPSTATACSGCATGRGRSTLLGPTHEEMFTLLVKDVYSSLQGPWLLSLYQIQTKYRDEARPRAGLLRGREFVMKDSYSSDIDDEGLAKSYAAHRDAYQDLRPAGLRVRPARHVRCDGRLGKRGVSGHCRERRGHSVRSPGGYAANVEAVQTTPPLPVPYDDAPAAHVEDTPDTPTIETLVDLANAHVPQTDRPLAGQ